MQGTYGVDNIILDLDIVDVNAVDTVLCRPYYFRTCDCRPNSKRNCRPKSVELMDGSQLNRESLAPKCDTLIIRLLTASKVTSDLKFEFNVLNNP